MARAVPLQFDHIPGGLVSLKLPHVPSFNYIGMEACDVRIGT